MLERAIPAALDALEVGGRIVVLAYQSLEDRIVKRELAARSTSTAPAWPSRRTARAPSRVQAAGARRRTRERGREGRELARDPGAPARRRTSEGGSMSAVAVARPLRQPSRQPARTRRAATSRSSRPGPSAARGRACCPRSSRSAGIGVILLAQLLLSIVIADGAYQITGLQSAKHDAVLQQHALSEQLDLLASPQHLAANAEALGMVASGSAVYLDSKTGAVTGSGSAAGGSMLGSGDQVGNVLLTGTAAGDTERRRARRPRPRPPPQTQAGTPRPRPTRGREVPGRTPRPPVSSRLPPPTSPT